MSQLDMFGLNIYYLIGLLIALGAGLVLLVVVWTGVKALLWHIQMRRARQAYHERTRREDGRRYPPTDKNAS